MDDDRVFCCSCHQSFPSFNNAKALRVHNKAVHRHFRYECSICNNVFLTDAILQMHKQDSHRPPPPPPPPAQQQQDQAGQPQGNIIIFLFEFSFHWFFFFFLLAFVSKLIFKHICSTFLFVLIEP